MVAGRNPSRTICSCRPLAGRASRYCPFARVTARATASPRASSSITTAPATGDPDALSRTIPRISKDCAEADDHAAAMEALRAAARHGAKTREADKGQVALLRKGSAVLLSETPTVLQSGAPSSGQ